MVKEAIKRLTWRFSKDSFTPNENDIEAVNEIVEFYNQSQKQQFQDNKLFAKLYIYMAMKIMEIDKTTVYDGNHRRKIGNLLKKPIEQITEDLQDSLNESELYALLSESGCEWTHPITSQQNTVKTAENISQAIKEPKNMRRFTKNVWSYEQVNEAITDEVNDIINLNRE